MRRGALPGEGEHHLWANLLYSHAQFSEKLGLTNNVAIVEDDSCLQFVVQVPDGKVWGIARSTK
jgi:hypothetical protein